MKDKHDFKERYDCNDLIDIVRILRAPGGCPWDREQTHESIKKNFIEETYEAIEAIDNNDSVLLKEELGDITTEKAFYNFAWKSALKNINKLYISSNS